MERVTKAEPKPCSLFQERTILHNRVIWKITIFLSCIFSLNVDITSLSKHVWINKPTIKHYLAMCSYKIWYVCTKNASKLICTYVHQTCDVFGIFKNVILRSLDRSRSNIGRLMKFLKVYRTWSLIRCHMFSIRVFLSSNFRGFTKRASHCL